MNTTELVLKHDSIKVIERIYTNLVQNRICKQGNKFYCYMCKAQIVNLINSIKHLIDDEDHQNRNKIGQILNHVLDDFEVDEVKSVQLVYHGIILTALPESYCTICSCKLPSIDHVAHHITGSRHFKNLSAANVVPTSSNVTVVQTNNNSHSTGIINSTDVNKTSVTVFNSSYVVANENTNPVSDIKPDAAYFCNKCLVILRSKEAIRYHIMFHTHQEACLCQNNDIITFSVKKHNQKFIKCIICDVEILNEEQLDRHLKETRHRLRINAYCQTTNLKDNIDVPSIDLNDLKDCLNLKNCVQKKLYCQKCDIVCDSERIFADHVNGRRHKISSLSTTQKFLVSQIVAAAENNKLEYQCFLCNIKFNDLSLYYNHNNLNVNHLKRMAVVNLILQDKSIVSIIKSEILVFKCFLCVTTHKMLHDVIDHILNSDHKSKLQDLNSGKIDNIPMPMRNFVFSCPYCQVYVSYDHMLFQHFKSKHHITAAKSLIGSGNYKFICPVCNTSFTSDSALQSHFQNPSHISKMNDITNTNKEFNKETQSNLIQQNNFNDSSVTSSSTSLHTDISDNTNKINAQLGDLKLSESTTSLNLDTHSKNKKNGNFTKSGLNTSTMSLNLNKDREPNKKVTFNESTAIINNKCVQKGPYTLRPKKTVPQPSNNSVNEKNDSAVIIKRDRQSRKPIKSGSSDSSSQAKLLSIYGLTYVDMCLEAGPANIFEPRSKRLADLKLGLSLTHPIDYEEDKSDDTKKSNIVCLACNVEISSEPLIIYEHLRSSEHKVQIRELKLHDEAFAEFSDQFSDLRLAKSYITASSDSDDELLECRACDCELENKDSLIAEHISSIGHLDQSLAWQDEAESRLNEIIALIGHRGWYYAQKFTCEPCNLRFDTELGFIAHLVNAAHLADESKPLDLEICPSCVSCWIGGPDSYANHCKDSFHSYFLRTRSFLAPALPTTATALLGKLEASLKTLLVSSNALKPTLEAELLGKIGDNARRVYPKAQVKLYGSRLALVGLSDSEFRVHLDFGEDAKDDDYETRLLKIQKTFAKQDEWNVEVPYLSKTPITLKNEPVLALCHRPSNIFCEITCKDTDELAVEKSRLIRCYNEAYPVCRELILILKKWTCCCNLSEYNKFTTFTISLLVVFYLQIRKILPSVRELINFVGNQNLLNLLNSSDNAVADENQLDEENDKELVDQKPKEEIVLDTFSKFDTINSKNIKVVPTSQSFKDLLKDLFLYYANFDYQVYAMSPFLGQPVKKRALIDSKDHVYKYMKTRVDKMKILRIDCPMCVQDPVDLLDNVTKTISKYQLRSFIKYCSESTSIL